MTINHSDEYILTFNKVCNIFENKRDTKCKGKWLLLFSIKYITLTNEFFIFHCEKTKIDDKYVNIHIWTEVNLTLNNTHF